MNKTLKAIGLTAAIAVMIPLSAYAATTSSSSANTDGDKVIVDKQIGKDEVKRVMIAGERGRFVDFFSQEVLDLLKLDAAAMKEKIASGKTLAQIAEEQGVSRDELKKAMTAAFEKQQAEEKQAFTDSLDKSVDSPIGTLEGKGFGMMVEKGMFIEKADFNAAAKLLGLSLEDLKKALGEGKSLADLAKEKGVDVQKLIDAQKQAIVDNLNEAVKAGKLTQAEADKAIADAGQQAERIVNGKMFDKAVGKKKFHVVKIDRNGVKQETETKTDSDSGTSTTETNA
ncbi:hypothetical protein [Paenibacillus montanisoli]|uniref:Uncharacterized protein n=1 Tax=Paenibacillus montanisoli TaxID=2081970 RepID=A0A328TWD5_9BACL|nr:hypothetical protein [Paenibacillus montanisoli]RAP73853.1 hypothetical protein DL346_26785 [Paenibacillus montanisoli]